MSLARDIADLGSSATRLDTVVSNIVINGAMNVAQRGTSETGVGASDGYFTVDRFKIDVDATSAGRLTMSQTADGPSGFANCIKLDCTTADTSIAAGERLILRHIIEGQDLQQLKKGTSDAESFTISFYVKGNAAATYSLSLYDGDNGRTISQTFSVTTSWNRIELTFAGDTTGAFGDDNGASLFLDIFLHAGSSYTSGTLGTSWASNDNATRAVGISSFFDSTDREFFITGYQMEVGSTATDFEHRSFGEELIRCQRYTYVIAGDDDDMTGIMGYGESASNARFPFVYPVIMRTSPSFTLSGTCRAQGGTADGANFTSGLAIINENTNHTGAALRVTGTSNLANDRGYNLQIKANGTTLTFDAEL